MTAPSTANLTPVKIDMELYRIYLAEANNEARIGHEVKTIERYTKLANKGPLPAWEQKSLDDAKARLAELQNVRQDLINEKAPYEVEYLSRPWHRYFLVTNGNGHVHRNMTCRTCFPTTQYAWLVELADCDEATMVEDYGEKACTVCFPDAPALPAFHGPGRYDREAREAKEAEKAAKLAAKNAKLLVEPVRIHHTSWPITTLAAAKQEIRDAIRYTHYYGDKDGKHAADIVTLTEALLRKGVEQAEIDTIIARARKAAAKG